MLMAICRHLPLNFITWPEYQALLLSINPIVDGFLVSSGGTIATNLKTAYAAYKQVVKRRLLSAQSLIHISIDVWSSP